MTHQHLRSHTPSHNSGTMDISAPRVIANATPPIKPNITIIEWEMLDKRKFFPLSMMSSFTVRCFLYPLTLIRTRLQVGTCRKLKFVWEGFIKKSGIFQI